MRYQGFESIVGNAILGRTSVEEAASKVGLLYAVQRAIFCPGCEVILDVRSAHLTTVSDGGEIVGCPVCTAALVAAAIRKGISVTVYPTVEPVKEAVGQCGAAKPDGSDRCTKQAPYRVTRKRGRKEYGGDCCDTHAHAGVRQLASVRCYAVTVRPIIGAA